MALPGYKEIVDLVKKGATLEAQEKIMELREGSILLQEENFDLREQLREAKEKLKEKESLQFIGEVYFSIKDEGRDGPFCPACYDSKDRLIRMHEFYSEDGNEWHCKICDRFYQR